MTTEWRDVTHAPPPSGERILVKIREQDRIMIGTIGNRGIACIFEGHETRLVKSITHWMPLPKFQEESV